MADVEADVATGQPKRRTFKKFSFRGVDLDALLDMSTDELVKLFTARARRRFQRGLKRKPMALIKKLRKAKREAPPGEKPEPVRTHLRNMIIVPEMIGSIVGVYNGKTFNQVEIKPEMIGHYLAEFSISYKPVKHGRPVLTSRVLLRALPKWIRVSKPAWFVAQHVTERRHQVVPHQVTGLLTLTPASGGPAAVPLVVPTYPLYHVVPEQAARIRTVRPTVPGACGSYRRTARTDADTMRAVSPHPRMTLMPFSKLL
ncbi:hypothetical protein H6P81_005470 [Aristolochia fimbriata]|uniref:40S ribosomal protein S15 n=1 Tax=Aristolochia fimbriata TaxID=158543 RepID=A0AAV7EY93_ARIFI|nr:hypothetical protein H6P81_005470 [Aristolochia fimbriata]